MAEGKGIGVEVGSKETIILHHEVVANSDLILSRSYTGSSKPRASWLGTVTTTGITPRGWKPGDKVFSSFYCTR